MKEVAVLDNIIATKLTSENIKQAVECAGISFAKPWKDIGGDYPKGMWYLDLDLISGKIVNGKECPIQISIEYTPVPETFFLVQKPYDHIDNWLMEVGNDMDNDKAVLVLREELARLLKLISVTGLVRRLDDCEYVWKISPKKHTDTFFRKTKPRGMHPLIRDGWQILYNPLAPGTAIS